jgi:hypothetical protein
MYSTIQKLYNSWSTNIGNLNIYRNHSTKYNTAAKIRGDEVTKLRSYRIVYHRNYPAVSPTVSGGRFTRMANWTGFSVKFNLKKTHISKEIKFVKGRYCICVFTARILNSNAVTHRADSQDSGLRVVTTLRAWMCKEARLNPRLSFLVGPTNTLFNAYQGTIPRDWRPPLT